MLHISEILVIADSSNKCKCNDTFYHGEIDTNVQHGFTVILKHEGIRNLKRSNNLKNIFREVL